MRPVVADANKLYPDQYPFRQPERFLVYDTLESSSHDGVQRPFAHQSQTLPLLRKPYSLPDPPRHPRPFQP
jgi:hypothetical protein